MLAADYRDAWGHDRALAIAEARQLFSHFFALQIVTLAPLRISEESEALAVSAPVGVFGSGTAVAQAVIEEVRDARGDAVFVWRRAGGMALAMGAGRDPARGTGRALVALIRYSICGRLARRSKAPRSTDSAAACSCPGSIFLPLISTMKRPPAITLAEPDLSAVRYCSIPLRP